ncbi:putative oxidoreductase C-terminal domain-containing protein [Flagellimonas myxillae]|uniref:putative oxidoreductase C-terminal domain-containing protein n=1 Tax=Flagellimonas myxillae TaxID=2942214 RepID=UPI00201F1A29|nr:putative oxidoreductase C-terminal domain-containing protein [Muricauda myxillae]MCL6265041.1 oxidoreductase [Muricauda myxillae]
MKRQLNLLWMLIPLFLICCKQEPKSKDIKEVEPQKFTGAKGEVKLMTLDPGHFHASLILKTMYDQMNPEVHIFAPDGDDLEGHLARVEGFNSREENPTSWDLNTYRGDDFFEKMIAEKPGNVMNVSGNNSKKTEFILKTLEAGVNVLADKPMAIDAEGFQQLEKAFQVAEDKGVLLYDIMTERYEITTMLQRALSQIPSVFGELLEGSPEEPAITKESVHHFSKLVAGKPLTRPAWFFDTAQQGEGIVDVNTHLVDLIQWEAFPGQVLSKDDVELVSARRWTTDLTPEMFKSVTHLDTYPAYLQKDVDGELLKVHSNGEIIYKLKGVHAKASVIWNFKAPEGAKDTHYSIMRGSKCDLIIEQGAKEAYKPTLYLASKDNQLTTEDLQVAIDELAKKFPGLGLEKLEDKLWKVAIPEQYKVGHEAHFGQVTQKYLQFLKAGKLPDWEVPNMITKYYTTTAALQLAKQQ